MPNHSSSPRPSSSGRKPVIQKPPATVARRKRATSIPTPKTDAFTHHIRTPDEQLVHERLVTEVRQLILEGVTFPPGSKLNFGALKKALHGKDVATAGDVTLRRALIDLEFEQLVEIRPHSGTYVRSFDGGDKYSLWRTRVVLEDLFVSSLASNPTAHSNEALQRARTVNEQIIYMAANLPSDPVDRLKPHIMALDIEFHECLAVAAGYPMLQHTLTSIRNQLLLAAGPNIMTRSLLQAVGIDHARILDSICPQGGGSWIGNMQGARLAMNAHLRNAAERLGISPQVDFDRWHFGNSPLWDLPDQLSVPQRSATDALIILRTLLELVVASELSRQQLMDRLSTPRRLCQEMENIAKRHTGKSSGDIDSLDRANFISLDIQFHASLCFISGLGFPAGGVLYAWRLMHDDANRKLSGDLMSLVVREHYKILHSLELFGGEHDESTGPATILRYVQQHLVSAICRSRSEDAVSVPDGNGPADLTLSNLFSPVVPDFLEWFARSLISPDSLKANHSAETAIG